IGDSMARGMESMLGRIQAAAAAMVTAASAALVAKAMIGSPSKLFMGYGEFVGEGFELGIRSMMPDAARAAAALVATPELPGYGSVPAFAHVGGAPSTTVTNTYGDIIIQQQPGEDGEALARRVISRLESDYDMVGR